MKIIGNWTETPRQIKTIHKKNILITEKNVEDFKYIKKATYSIFLCASDISGNIVVSFCGVSFQFLVQFLKPQLQAINDGYFFFTRFIL